MKKYFGLFLIFFSFNTLAGGQNAMLMLRAVVPETFKMEVTMGENGPTARIRSNKKHTQSMPKFHVKKINNKFLVSFTQP